MAFDIEMIRNLYGKFPSRINSAKKMLAKPMTLTEKKVMEMLVEKLMFMHMKKAKEIKVY